MTPQRRRTPPLGAVLVISWVVLLSACGTTFHSASERQGLPTVQPVLGLTPAPGAQGAAGWRMTASHAVITVVGRPMSVIFVALHVSPTPCGPTDIRFNGTPQAVRAETNATTTVILGESGAASLPLDSDAPACRSSPAAPPSFLFVAAPVATVLGPSGAPWVQPVGGFALPEQAGEAEGWWMTSPRGRLEVHGKPGVAVVVTLALNATPCGPVSVSLGGRVHDVHTGQHLEVRVVPNRQGVAEIPVTVASAGCTAAPDPRSLYAMVFDPVAATAR